MTHEFLKKNAEFLGEIDWNSTGIYYGCSKYYLYENAVYKRSEPTNQLRYDGEPTTVRIVDDVEKELKEYNSMYFTHSCQMDESIYEKLCERYGVKPAWYWEQ